MSNLLKSTKVRNVLRMTVASAVGSLVAWVAVKYGKLTTGALAFLAPAVSAAYFAVVHWLEVKFPALGWLLGLLPHKKTAPVSTPVPTPAPAVKATKPVKKVTKKKA